MKETHGSMSRHLPLLNSVETVENGKCRGTARMGWGLKC